MDKWLSLTPILGALGIINMVFGVGAVVNNIIADRAFVSPALQALTGIILIVYWANKP